MRIIRRIRNEQLARRPHTSSCPKTGCRGSKQ
jgi:hypothetical protein